MKTLRDVVVNPDTIYIDGRQDYAKLAQADPHFAVCGLPVGDVAWIRDGRLYVVEEKKSNDLENSVKGRRLQKQLRRCIAQADYTFLALRTSRTITWGMMSLALTKRTIMEVNKFVRWGHIVFLPAGRQDALNAIPTLITAVMTDMPSILAGTDEHPKKETKRLPPFQRAVRRLFDGVGGSLAPKLDRYFESDLSRLLSAGESELREAGAHSGIIRQIESLRKKEVNNEDD